jgi:hypothetical protein
MIVIAGDSWGCGEWKDTKRTHTGLEQYLCDDNHDVINISMPSASPGNILSRLSLLLEVLTTTHQIENITHVFVFQTEWVRDFRLSMMPEVNDLVRRKEYPKFVIPTWFDATISGVLISRWYYRLVELTKKYNIRIGLIGGCSDTLSPEIVKNEYPNLYVACQSLTNLCIYNQHILDNPVFLASSDSDDFLDHCKKQYGSINYIVELLESALQRYQAWDDHPEWFKPDGIHANRHSHFKLYTYLKEQFNL